MSRGEEYFKAALGTYETLIVESMGSLADQNFSKRVWAKDASIWKSDPATQEKIKNRLGWLSVTALMAKQSGELKRFAQSVKDDGINRILLLGMGGSSLCPEVLRRTYGVAPGYPELEVLDTTDPAAIRTAEKDIDLKHTLFIVSSKSGTTIETQSLYAYFLQKVRGVMGDSFGRQFIAITDPGTGLERLAREASFRSVFLTPPDIGGRYSALSYFGLVPAALIGIDLEVFLDRAQQMIQSTAAGVGAPQNPAVKLGVILGELGKVGRNKVTLIASPAIGSFGVWAEQLLAESTGKEGKGLVPIEGEMVGPPSRYGNDRLFIYLSVKTLPDSSLDKKVQDLEAVGQPVVRIRLRDSMDLAGEFFRWEMATAVSGAVLGINPFDEPNVSESKENTKKVLDEYQKTGALASPPLVLEENGVGLFGNVRKNGSMIDTLWGSMNQVKVDDYVALMAYVGRSPSHDHLLQKFRDMIGKRLKIATTLGYGPRFLHSTGQLHKGGPRNGVFIQITAEDADDLSIPGENYSFGVLKRAQALGDFQSLSHRGFRVMRLHFGGDFGKDFKNFLDFIENNGKK